MTLAVDETMPGSIWHTSSVDYSEGPIIHVWPNQSGHTEDMRDGDDCWCQSNCTCGVSYDLADDGTVVVIHNPIAQDNKGVDKEQ